MRKLIIDGLVIFISIFASFSVENYREAASEKSVLNDAVITLGEEMVSNIEYTKEHLKQVKNMNYLNNEMIKNFKTISPKDIFDIHSNNPFIHRALEAKGLSYVKKYNLSFKLNDIVLGNPKECFLNPCLILVNY